MESLIKEIADALDSALAARGLVLRGEVRGVLAEVGRPETGAGCSAPVGGGPPPAWAERERREAEVRKDLLAACEAVLTGGSAAKWEAARKLVRAAVAKAKGQ